MPYKTTTDFLAGRVPSTADEAERTYDALTCDEYKKHLSQEQYETALRRCRDIARGDLKDHPIGKRMYRLESDLITIHYGNYSIAYCEHMPVNIRIRCPNEEVVN